MNAWIILVVLGVLIGCVLLLGVVVIVLLVTRPDHRTTPARLSEPVAQQAQSLPSGCLIAVSGGLEGHSFALQPPPRGLVIGRNSDNDIVVNAAMVSRHHAQVMVEGEQVVLYDRDSTNGTWLVDGSRVSRYVLSIGDRFQIGDVVFVYALPNQPLPPQPPARQTQPVAILQPKTFFEGYLLLDILGHGGMSVVYRAQAQDGMCVAIKILDATDEWVARKFIQEGNIGSALRGHPNIRIVYDLCYSQDRRPYLVMEYIEGKSLRKLLGTQLPIAQIVGIIGQVCEALEFAHQRCIVHRDIKPENILVATDGTVKVTDFGIAKLTSAVTVTNDRIVGTPEYISPEQAKGEDVRPSSDIYSLGVVLYELLTGQVPFPLPVVSDDQDQRGAAYTVIRQHIHTAPTPPGKLKPEFAASPLEKVTLRALEKDPNKRYRRALDFARSLNYRPSQAIHLLNVWERQQATAAAGVHLLLVDGPNRGQVIPIQGTQLVIGRAMLDRNNLQISRQHAILVQKGQEWWIQDMSMNGTRVNGLRVYGQVPLDGDRIIEIAEHRMQLRS